MQKRRPEKVVFRLRFDLTASKKDTPMGRIPICRHPVAVPSECPRLSKAFVPRCPFVVPGRNFACQSRLVSCRPRHTLHLPLTLPLAAGKFVSAATHSPPLTPPLAAVGSLPGISPSVRFRFHLHTKNRYPKRGICFLVPATGIEPVRILLRGIFLPL